MHHLIFIPNKPDLPRSLDEAGLSNHQDKATFTLWEDGPEKMRGCCVSWPGGLKPVYKPGPQQVWIPAISHKGYDACRYYVGYDPHHLPDPQDLVRDSPIPGVPAKMADGQFWLLPTISGLPVQWQFTEDGYRSKVKPEFLFFQHEVMRMTATIHDTETVSFEMGDVIKVIDHALFYNYRLPRELSANVLNLHDSESVTRAFKAIVTGAADGNV